MRNALVISAFLVVLAGCRTVAPLDGQEIRIEASEAPTYGAEAGSGETAPRPPELSERQRLIVEAARDIVETQSTVAGETTYSYDCTGTILTVYARAGIYLVRLFPNYTGNGVARLYGIATDYKVLHTRTLPEPGDVIFWDNTYDRNEDGKWNDPLTHAGVVVSVAADGTVEFIHHNYRRGIVMAQMNLLEPGVYQTGDGTEVNSPMRMASQRAANPDLWLASHLFREFGSLYRITVESADTGGTISVASAR